jgi:hypothetical protein
MRIGQLLRYGRPKDPRPPTVDGLPNFWHLTDCPGRSQAQLERGINVIARTDAQGSQRVPAILLSSSPHKVGSAATPWQDHLEPDAGLARYFGDHKPSHAHLPDASPGNRAMLGAWERHSSIQRATRLQAEPLVLFRRVAYAGRQKGFVEFEGIGIIERVELLTQLDVRTGLPFANYAFDILILDLSKEGEELSWEWICQRRDPAMSDEDCLGTAPSSWQEWVQEGDAARVRLRRSVARLAVASKGVQVPTAGTPEDNVLKEVVAFYSERKHRFEALAELLAARVLAGAGTTYRLGWITQRGHDFGIDFVGRLDIGSGFARTSLVVLGQAKCEQSATSARDIARTIARLQRGWLGCYVTTSYFSSSVQQEVLEDKYPIALIHGRRVGEETRNLAFERGAPSVNDLLKSIDSEYQSRLAQRRPEEVLRA